MKVFAIITACLMTAGGAAYYFHSLDSSAPCCKLKNAPVAQTGGCCPTDTSTPDCCKLPCSACATDCQACCDMCEQCCTAGAAAVVKTPVAAKVEAEEECCEHCLTPVKRATSAAIAGISLK